MRARSVHTTSRLLQRDRRERELTPERSLDLNMMGQFQFDDVPTFGHMRLQKQREMLAYYRLMANEFPKLKGTYVSTYADLHEPFQPPAASSFLTFKFTHYQGEEHPDASKVVLTLPVRDLFQSKALTSMAAKHKFLLLAGPRWQPPTASLVERWNAAKQSGDKTWEALASESDLGTVKIASKTYPNESQNMKWCSDVLDKMVSEANVRTVGGMIRLTIQAEPSFADVPLDVRPYVKRTSRGGRTPRPTKADFPAEWL
ncbi:37S ribosomal protein S24, mitochondrial [Malassezia pachydermatis]